MRNPGRTDPADATRLSSEPKARGFRGGKRRRVAVTAAALALFLSASVSGVSEEIWHQIQEGRWRELTLPSEGETGFTQLGPQATGVQFTNLLGEAASAANRVLENGSGVAIGDYDQDGQPDLFFCSLSGRNALFRNLGGWKFADSTVPARLDGIQAVCRGAVFADVNGDRWPDLLISTLGQGVLCFMNDGTGRFQNETSARVPPMRSGSMTLAVADADGNGTLDLYVANYRTDDIRDRSRIEVQRVNGQVMPAPALRDRIVLTPDGVREFGEPDAFWLNDGQGHFRAVSWTGGAFFDEEGKALTRAPADWGLSVTFRDLNGDGAPDLYVCNDYWTPDRIWMNRGNGQFKAVERFAIRHTSENSMGLDVADLDRDGHMDLLVLDMLSREPGTRKRQLLAQTKVLPPSGNIPDRPQIMRNVLFHNRGDGTFEEVAEFAGLPGSEWAWQPVFMDVDLDGYEDLLISAGHRRDVQDLDATARIRALQHPWPRDMSPAARQEAFTREMMEHVQLYPPLECPILAFRNDGHLHFTEMTRLWGTEAEAVHQGIALADLDGDGDLDFVVNNLNGPCGVYRNNAGQPRIAVRLRGLPPNTAGIGARVSLKGGAVPTQRQEMVCGGRYLSGFENLLVFAATRRIEDMRLEVEWRSGRRTVLGGVRGNRLYEITEPDVAASAKSAAVSDATTDAANPARPAPLFQDASEALAHLHEENAFDEDAWQPLLPRHLSSPGPGVVCMDLNEDGLDDLVVGGSRGGRMALFQGDGKGGFQRLTNSAGVLTRDQGGLVALRARAGPALILAASANYEDGVASGASVRAWDASGNTLPEVFAGSTNSMGPLALADIDGDGDLDLFVGGRVIPRKYPQPASSLLFRQTEGRWEIDLVNSGKLQGIGLVGGAVWTDVNNDGWPDLILACEWGPLRAFRNTRGSLEEITESCGLTEFTGWWSGVSAGDFDGDGQMDLVAGNWGWNSAARATRAEPARLYYGDFLQRGTVDLMEAEYDPARKCYAPLHRLDEVASALPFLREHFASARAFSEASIDEALGAFRSRASIVEARTLASTLFLNRAGRFVAAELPVDAQKAPAHAICVADFDGDGHEDVFLSQNWFALPWSTPRQDAGRGLLLLGNGRGGFQAVPGQDSGVLVYGEQRGAATADFNRDGRTDLVVAQNGSATRLLLNRSGRPGLRVRLKGPAGNPDGIGALLRTGSPEHWGPAREVHAGSGYWSQDSPVQVLARPAEDAVLWVRWPGGRSTTNALPRDARELTVEWR